MENVAVAIEDLGSRVDGLELEGLGQNELFVTIVTRAGVAAVMTHESEKLDALKNIVLNAAMSGDHHAERELMLLNVADQFTALHIRLLL